MNDFMDMRTAQEKHEENQSSFLENCYMVRDLIMANKETAALYRFFKELLKTQRAVKLTIMGNATKRGPVMTNEGMDMGDIPFELEDFWKHVGIAEGLAWLKQEVDWMIKKANEDENGKR